MSRERVIAAYRAALEATDPEEATRRALESLPGAEGVWIAALGKAAPAMLRGAWDAVGTRLRGFVAVGDHVEVVPAGGTLLLGDHPMPGVRSQMAGSALFELVGDVPPDDLLIVLISGGGSALAEVPVAGLSVDDIATVTRRLMDAATPIEELNLVRRHMSHLKNGGLLAASGATRVITLLVSDVIDADPSVIASGPTLADDSTPGQAEAVIRHRLGVDPPRLGAPREPGRHHHRWQVIADGTIAAHAAAGVLEAEVWTTRLRGEASEQATAMVSARGGGAMVATGETTVTVRGSGVGGRNQEAALAAAIALDGGMGWFAAIGTDGIDGPTDAAGAIVDGGSVDRMRSTGVDPARALASNDSNPALRASGDLVITGPSGTNVGDLWMALP